MISNVQWQGLTSMVLDLKKTKPGLMGIEISALTKDMIGIVHQVYVENLSGASPSTAARPLPVGVRTGKLRQGAKKRQINQYSGEVTNEVEYAGFIETGTKNMAPRRPLGAAVDQVSEMVPGKMGQVLTTILV